MTRAVRRGLVLVLLCATPAAPHAGEAAVPATPAVRAAANEAAPALRLGRRLRASGRAECAFTRTAIDPWSGSTVTTRGRLALEPPDRARLDFAPARTGVAGERITLRGDGGEWVQPGMKQVIAFSAEQAAAAGRWWQLLIDGMAPGITVTAQSARVLLLTSSVSDAGPDSARLVLDAAGLPVRLEVPDMAGRTAFRFSGWTFRAPRGEAAFREPTPAGWERVAAP